MAVVTPSIRVFVLIPDSKNHNNNINDNNEPWPPNLKTPGCEMKSNNSNFWVPGAGTRPQLLVPIFLIGWICDLWILFLKIIRSPGNTPETRKGNLGKQWLLIALEISSKRLRREQLCSLCALYGFLNFCQTPRTFNRWALRSWRAVLGWSWFFIDQV